MNIIEQTLTKLKFHDHNQQWLWGVLLGIPLVAIGFGIALVVGNVTTLECQRTKPTKMTCQRTIAGLPGTETTLIPGQLTEAYVKTESGAGVVIYTSDPSNLSYELVNHRVLVREKHSQIAYKINAFIHNSQQPKLKIQEDDRWEGFFYGVPFFVIAIGFMQSLAIPMQVLCDFDIISGQMTLEKRYQLFGTFTTQKKLIEVQQAQVIQVPDTRIPWYFVQLELISAKPISLSVPTRDRRQCQIIVNAINRTLA